MKKLYFTFILYICLSAQAVKAGNKDIVINEIMAANVSYMLDRTYNYNGWVELYNASDKSINLAGYKISDEANNPDKFKFPENIGEIAAGEYKIIFFDNNELDKKNVNFKLDADGGTLYLFSKNNTNISSVEYGYAYPETSYARKIDGESVWGTCATPTPGKSNNNSLFSVKRVKKPQVNIAPGIYSGNLLIKMESNEGSIRYTTDGSEPNEHSKAWSGNLTINTTTILRARAYKKGYIPSEILTCTYIIDERLIDLPVISIVTDPDNLWNDSIGIYCVGTNGESGDGVSYPVNWNRDWRRPCNVEIFNNPHDKYITQQCDVSIGGGYSRSYPEKSLELNAEKKYEGKNSFDVRLFAQKPYYRFKSLTLRNSGNDFYRSMYCDAMQQSLYSRYVDVDYLAYQPAIHYINGEYYGIINIRERSNHHHVYSNWGYDKENLDFIYNSADNPDHLGDLNTLNNLLSLISQGNDSESHYNKISKILDIDEFINYVLIESFSGNTDWMSNNVKFYRSRNDGRFRWILFDLDAGFSNLNYNQFTASDRSGLSNTKAYTGKIFQGLKENPYFREKFISHATAIIGGIMREERYNAIIDSIVTLITNEIPHHRKRWSQGYNINSYATGYKNFAKERREVYFSQLASEFSLGEPTKVRIEPNVKTALYVNGVEVPTGIFAGYMNKGGNYTLSVDVPYGYKFKHWTVSTSSNIELSSNNNKTNQKPNFNKTTLNIEITGNGYSIIPTFEKIDTLHNHPVPAIRINELGANKEITYNDYYEKSDWIELYNLTDTIFDLSGLYISNNEENPRLYKIPENLHGKGRIAPHGYCILWADEETDKREFHLPFKLPSAGGRLILSAYDQGDSILLWRDEIEYTAHGDDRSFGRYPDGSDKLHELYRPTPGSINLYSSNNTFLRYDTITGYHLNDVKTSICSTEDEFAEIVETKYYNLSGQFIGNAYDNLPQGIYVRRTIYDNNSVKSEKIIKE